MRISTPARHAFCFAASLLMIGAYADSAIARPRKFILGPCVAMFGANVCSFYQTKSGQVSKFGLRIPLAALEQAPMNAPMSWPPKEDVDVPFASIVEDQTGFTFANIYWEAHGHRPKIYMIPHYDFHFYFISEDQVKRIDCNDTSKPASLPVGYALPDINIPTLGELVGLCVPAMGMHAVPEADLGPAAPWGASMIVGYYGGKPIFLEPMVARARLLEKQKFSLAIPQIEPTARVRYPKRFRAVYVPKSNVYDFIFSY